MLATFLRHGSNAVLVMAGIALTGWAVAARSPVVVLGVAAGALVFFVTEYTTHRFLLHASPSRHATVRRLQDRLHYQHHVEPGRLDLLFLPLWFAIPAFAVYAALYGAITRSGTLTLALVCGSVLALTYYEWVHYVAHIPFVPRTAYGRWIKKYHLRHHFKSERHWFGVTNPGMDVLARTAPSVASVERSATVRRLFG